MSKQIFTVFETHEDITVYGLKRKSNDKTQSKDIPLISKEYYAIVAKKRGDVIPFFVISKDYNENTRDFSLFIGGLLENENLEKFTIPRGLFVKTTIKPKTGLFWGLLIGAAKRSFYTDWLPKSDYTGLNMEYEYHTEASIGKNPQIDILFAVKGTKNDD